MPLLFFFVPGAKLHCCKSGNGSDSRYWYTALWTASGFSRHDVIGQKHFIAGLIIPIKHSEMHFIGCCANARRNQGASYWSVSFLFLLMHSIKCNKHISQHIMCFYMWAYDGRQADLHWNSHFHAWIKKSGMFDRFFRDHFLPETWVSSGFDSQLWAQISHSCAIVCIFEGAKFCFW